MKNDISAAVITMNHEKYIEQSIDSLLNQTLPLKKILVGVDYSQDRTLEIVKSYEKKYKNIKVFSSNSQIGPSAMSNLVLNESVSKYVIFTSGDDYSQRDRAKVQYELLTNNKDMACVSNNVEILNLGGKTMDVFIPKFHELKGYEVSIFSNLFWNQNFLNASAVCFNMEYLNSETFSTELRHLADFELWLKLSLEDRLLLDKRKILTYRISSNSLSQLVNHDKNEECRVERELSIVYKYITELLNFNMIKKHFIHFLKKFDLKDLDLIDTEFYKMLILFSHNNPIVQKVALEYAGLTKVQKKYDNFTLGSPRLYDIVESMKIDNFNA
jgi:glycosyltransferase involved in cell wall biosynthesis